MQCKNLSSGLKLIRFCQPALILLAALTLALMPGVASARREMPHGESLISAAGDTIPRIQCPAGYTARVYAEGLSSPDGLAFSPAGMLYVAEEEAGRVSRIEVDGRVTPFIDGLDHPEGIAFDDEGNLYVVEDVEQGRLLKVAPDGTPTVLADDLDGPEGVVWVSDGTVYVTESNIQFASNPPDDIRTHVTAVSPSGSKTRIRTDAQYWSYAGIVAGRDGRLYVANEVSGVDIFQDSVFVVDPVSGERSLLAKNLIRLEGLRFAANGGFPLYVVQEDTGDERGMLSRVEANGSHTPFCTGFYNIEDVIQDNNGRLYVSEDDTGAVVVVDSELPQLPHANAIILFIGDGMSETHRTAARWSDVGRRGALHTDRMASVGWSHTASANNSVTDSAAAATAIATGTKTNNGMIGQDPAGNRLVTILEDAQARGMAVGLVTTVQMAHATPAAYAAHIDDRDKMTEIASQMLTAGVNVLLGGGEDEFLPTGTTGCYPEPGERSDGRDLTNEAVAAGYIYVCNPTDFAAVVPTSTTYLLGLFADEGMARPFSPSLEDMTQKAIDILSQDPDGFFLMVEAGQIDWASHDSDAANAIIDSIGLDKAVAMAQAYAASAGDTLIIVTGDHDTGGMGADLISSGLPSEQGPFAMPEGTPFYVNWSTGEHTAVDVLTTAQGPWSALLDGTHDNTYIHEVMRQALIFRVWLPVILRQ